MIEMTVHLQVILVAIEPVQLVLDSHPLGIFALPQPVHVLVVEGGVAEVLGVHHEVQLFGGPQRG